MQEFADIWKPVNIIWSEPHRWHQHLQGEKSLVILVEQLENTFLLFSQIQSASKLIVCFRHGSNGYVPEKQFGIHQGFI